MEEAAAREAEREAERERDVMMQPNGGGVSIEDEMAFGGFTSEENDRRYASAGSAASAGAGAGGGGAAGKVGGRPPAPGYGRNFFADSEEEVRSVLGWVCALSVFRYSLLGLGGVASRVLYCLIFASWSAFLDSQAAKLSGHGCGKATGGKGNGETSPIQQSVNACMYAAYPPTPYHEASSRPSHLSPSPTLSFQKTNNA